MYKIYAGNQVIHHPNLFHENYICLEPVVNKTTSGHGSMTFTMPQNHPYYDDIENRTTIIRVFDDTEELFRGRVLDSTKDFYGNKEIYVEGELAFLLDSYYRPFGYSGGVSEFFEMLIENHNSQVDETRQFTVGEVTVTDSNDYITRSSETAQTTWELINSRLLELLGGYIRTRLENGVRYIDYLADFEDYSDQAIKFGENLLDLEEYISAENVITCLIPYGAEYEENDDGYTEQPENGSYNGNRLTIESVNDGVDYIENETGIALYGRVWGTNTWDDVTIASNLLSKAEAYLSDSIIEAATLTINALDLHLVDVDTTRIHIGEYVKVYSRPHNINMWMLCTEQKIDLAEPDKTEITLGVGTATLTSTVASGSTSSSSYSSSSSGQYDTTALLARIIAIENSYVTTDDVDNLVSNSVTVQTLIADVAAIETAYITEADVETLLADYASIEILEAATARIDTLEANQITAEDLSATYATIENLNASNARIETLEASTAEIGELSADVASIKVLLAGTEGVETLEAIHLTADNVVIDDAIITDAMIATLSASKITAGTIYTSLVTIQTSDGDKSLYITDSLIAMYDANNVQRLQAGMSSESEGYNFVIWDGSGTELFNATGITASGIPSETIIDDHVAENAAISGTKLNITSVAECLNDDGSIVVTAAQVTIDETTLDYKLTSIATLVNGAVETTETLQSELEVVQGQITSKIWQADIDELVYDNRNYVLLSGNYVEGGQTGWYGFASQQTFENHYSISVEDGYTRIGCITATTSNTMYAYIPLSDDFDSSVQHTITAKVRLSTAVALALRGRWDNSGTTYSATWTTFSADSFTDGEWVEVSYTVTPKTEYSYLAIGFALENVNTVGAYLDIAHIKVEQGTVSTAWTPAPEDEVTIVTTVSDKYSTLEQTVSGIETEVGEISTTVSENYSELTTKITAVSETADGIVSTVEEMKSALSENVIKDGTFDGYTTFGASYSWYRPSSTYITVSTYSDKPCIKFTRGSSSYYIRQAISLDPGTYIIKMKIARGEDVTPAILVGVGSGAAAARNAGVYLHDEGELTTEWATYTATITIDSDSTYFYLFCYETYGSTTAATTEAYVTDITMYESVELTASMSRIEQLADSISLSVSGGVGSEVSIVLSVDGETNTGSIDLTGAVTFSDLETSGSTTINGDNITTGTLSASLIDIDTLMAQDITATGSFQIINTSLTLTASDSQILVYPTSGHNSYDTIISQGHLEFCNSNYTSIPLYSTIVLTSSGVDILSNSDITLDSDTVTVYGATTLSSTLSVEGTTSAGGITVTRTTAEARVTSTTNYGTGRLVMTGSTARYGLYNATASSWIIYGSMASSTSGYVYIGGNRIYAGSTYWTVSDRRKKHDIQVLKECLADAYLAMLDNMEPARFIFNQCDDDSYSFGYIAQDVKVAAINAGLSDHESKFVHADEDGYMWVDYTELIPLLHLKIKQQEARISELEKQVKNSVNR